jgi:hypothetical protein
VKTTVLIPAPQNAEWVMGEALRRDRDAVAADARDARERVLLHKSLSWRGEESSAKPLFRAIVIAGMRVGGMSNQQQKSSRSCRFALKGTKHICQMFICSDTRRSCVFA